MALDANPAPNCQPIGTLLLIATDRVERVWGDTAADHWLFVERVASDSSEATVRTAVDRFLSSARCRNPNTRSAYADALDRLAERLGAGRCLDELDAEELAAALDALWGDAAASTWNQRRSAVGSWLAVTPAPRRPRRSWRAGTAQAPPPR